MLLTVKPKKVALYMADGKYTAQQVRALTGADIVINGTLYTFATMKPCQDVKANGVVYSDEYYHYSGFGWNNNSVKLQHSYDMNSFDNFFSCCDLIFNGQDCDTSSVAWVQGARQRSAIGLTAEGEIVVYATQYATTIAQVKQTMREARCVEAINLDGGGSTQISTKAYGELYSSRRVQNYICIWAAAPESKPTPSNSSAQIPAATTPVAPSNPVTVKPKAQSYWKATPLDATAFPLKIRGTCALNQRANATSASQLVRVVPKGQAVESFGYAAAYNKNWMRVQNGYLYRAYTECGNPYRAPSVQLKRWSVGEGVKWLQWYLGAMKYKGADGRVLGCDGSFGPNTETALKEFQRANGLTVDGICGTEVVKKMKELVIE